MADLKEAILKMGYILSDVINEVMANDDRMLNNLSRLQACLKNHLDFIESIK